MAFLATFFVHEDLYVSQHLDSFNLAAEWVYQQLLELSMNCKWCIRDEAYDDGIEIYGTGFTQALAAVVAAE
jgi:hypothetical protein